MRARGCSLRLITDISRNNISYCKELAKYVELRHFDGIKGNFGIVDGKATAALLGVTKNSFLQNISIVQ
jgi:hypothetical protein